MPSEFPRSPKLLKSALVVPNAGADAQSHSLSGKPTEGLISLTAATCRQEFLPWDIALESLSLAQHSFRAPDPQTATPFNQ